MQNWFTRGRTNFQYRTCLVLSASLNRKFQLYLRNALRAQRHSAKRTTIASEIAAFTWTSSTNKPLFMCQSAIPAPSVFSLCAQGICNYWICLSAVQRPVTRTSANFASGCARAARPSEASKKKLRSFLGDVVMHNTQRVGLFGCLGGCAPLCRIFGAVVSVWLYSKHVRPLSARIDMTSLRKVRV